MYNNLGSDVTPQNKPQSQSATLIELSRIRKSASVIAIKAFNNVSGVFFITNDNNKVRCCQYGVHSYIMSCSVCVYVWRSFIEYYEKDVFVCVVLYVTVMLFYEGVIESEKEPCSLNHCRTNTSPCVAKHCWFRMKAALASVTPSFMAK